ncbi:hypothetical protein [Pseudescherichia vulneris]|uniref:hypothetical protein n=1 Tax=Pseudescherichia vulneris TaxID=566 RepID=UPI0028AAA6A7|nr:hypothetical protein [Pseudescherichia vulneris]
MNSRTFPFRSNAERTYILLTEVIDIAENSILGGKNKAQKAKEMARVQYGDGPWIEDDIDFTKKIFRNRSKHVVTKFLDDENIEIGDMLRIEKVSALTYRITAVKKRAK